MVSGRQDLNSVNYYQVTSRCNRAGEAHVICLSVGFIDMLQITDTRYHTLTNYTFREVLSCVVLPAPLRTITRPLVSVAVLYFLYYSVSLCSSS